MPSAAACGACQGRPPSPTITHHHNTHPPLAGKHCIPQRSMLHASKAAGTFLLDPTLCFIFVLARLWSVSCLSLCVRCQPSLRLCQLPACQPPSLVLLPSHPLLSSTSSQRCIADFVSLSPCFRCRRFGFLVHFLVLLFFLFASSFAKHILARLQANAATYTQQQPLSVCLPASKTKFSSNNHNNTRAYIPLSGFLITSTTLLFASIMF